MHGGKSPALEKAVSLIRQLLREHADTKLPPVRALARMLLVSPVTVFRALAVLREEGLITGVWGKGYFPAGAHRREEAREYVPHEAKYLKVLKAMRRDILDGTFRTGRSLPPQSRLAQLYKVSVPTMAGAILVFVKEGVLAREGARYFFCRNEAVSRRRVAVIAFGIKPESPKIVTEREQNFYRSLSSAAADHAVDLEIVCYNDYLDTPTFFLPEKHTLESYISGNRLCGIILSSYHMSDSVGCLRKLIGSGVPVSVWIEDQSILRSADRFGSLYKGLTFFDSSYSPRPGRDVGRYLFEKGHREIAYISPFHGSQWSKNRLEGLRKAASAYRDSRRVHPFVCTDYAYDYAFTEKVLEDATYDREAMFAHLMEKALPFMVDRVHVVLWEYETLLRDTLIFACCKKLIDRASSAPAITAWVCSNDLIACMIADFWNHGNVPSEKRPALIGFDNSFMSLERKVSTYDFNTDAEVRSMLGHLLHPGGRFSADRDYLVSVSGAVIERASSMGRPGGKG